MSIQRMRRRFAVQLRIVLWALTIAFIVGLPLVFVPGRFFGRDGEEREPEPGSAAVAAQVNGQPVTRAEVRQQFEQMIGQLLPVYASMGQHLGLEGLWQLRLDGMERAIQTTALAQEARKQGVSVSKGELKRRAEQGVDQQMAQLKGRFQGEELEEMLAQIAAENDPEIQGRSEMSERGFRKWALAFSLAPGQRLREDMLIEKLRESAVGDVSATEQDLLASYDRATVRRIVISRAPPGGAERTEEEAKQRAEALLARAKGGEDFAELAKAESDDPAAEQTGGLLENLGRRGLPKEWQEAVFPLEPGEVSPVIPLPGGYEIVKMEKKTRELPKDFEKNKDQLLQNLVRQSQEDAWRTYAAGVREKAKVEITDPEMLGYQAAMEGKEEEAIALLKEAVPQARVEGGLAAASMFYRLATLEASASNWQAAADAYAEAGDALLTDKGQMLPAGRAQALLGMGRAYERLGSTEEAVMWYTAASSATEVPSIHAQLLATFQRLGREDLVKQEKEWAENYQALQRERQEAMEAERKATEESAQPQVPSDAGKER